MKVKKGKDAFEEYYKNLFGDELDPFIKSLKKKRLPILRFNKKDEIKLKKLWRAADLEWNVLDWYPQALVWPESVSYGTILPGYKEHLIYPMSASSLLPIIALDLQSNDLLLDACAAPGGKTLAAIDQLKSSKQVVANDLSYARAMKMKRIFFDYGVYVDFSIKPAQKLHKTYPNYFDKILVDAPCSSEQHVYNSSVHLKRWSIKRIKKLQHRQITLIKSLLSCLKPGGRLVYSTCAVTPEENEYVIEKILDWDSDDYALSPIDWSGYPGHEGIQINPDFKNSYMRRTYPHIHQLDTMFVAAIDKKE